MTTDPVVSSLNRALPCREAQIEILYSVLCHKDEPPFPNIYVYGCSSSGKSAVVDAVLEELHIRHAKVNLVECYTSKILFENLLNQLAGHVYDPCNPVPYARCDNLMEFIEQLQRLEGLENSVLVLDKAEELRNMDANLLPAFLRFKEFTGIPVTVIYTSEIVFEKCYHKSSGIEPWTVHFPQYNKDELLQILALDFENVKGAIQKEASFIDEEFYKNYLNVFLSVFYRACRDLSELRYMSRINFPKYCQPVINKQCSTKDSTVLWRNIAPILKSSLEVLYLRVDASGDQGKIMAQDLELPYYAKYLLVAAYLASYNSAKDDKRLFMKHHTKKKKRIQDVKLKSKVSEQLNTQLGPKQFTLDRLLAIFYAILDEKVGFNNNLLVQVSSLVELRLLSTAGEGISLDGQKYKCNVGFDFVNNIARTIGINVRKYLSDFCHM